MSSNLPVGWRIETTFVPRGCDIECEYVAYRWQKYTKKKWPWSRPIEYTGWRKAGYASWRREEVGQWIIDTAEAEKMIPVPGAIKPLITTGKLLDLDEAGRRYERESR